MNCPKCGMDQVETKNAFVCGSFHAKGGKFYQSVACKKIAHLREMLLEALPYVQEEIHSFANNDITRKNIEDFAKRIENEVRE